MANTDFQPTLPAPVRMTEPELNFLDESPPGLFADNQNSNIGLKRKIFSDQMEQVKNQIALLYAERFVATATQTLDQWEEEVGLPVAPSGLTTQQRRARISARLKTGPFTRTRRQEIVETYLLSTFGATVQLIPSGVPLTVSGLPLYSDATSLVGLYTITENITNFSYTVTINATAQIDQAGLLRELVKITPAGINFNVTYTNQSNPAQSIQKAGGGLSTISGGGTKNLVASAANRAAVITWAEIETP